MPRDSSLGSALRLSASSNSCEQRVHLLAHAGDLIQPRHELQVLFDGEVVEEPRLVGHEGEMPFGVDGIVAKVESADADDAVGRRMDAGQRAQRGRLARAVRTDQPEDLAALDGEGEVLHRDKGVVVLREAGDFDAVVHAWG